MPINCLYVSELSPTNGVCIIKVRIVRKWGFPQKDKPQDFASMDLLLIDSKAVGPLELSTSSAPSMETTSQITKNLRLPTSLSLFTFLIHLLHKITKNHKLETVGVLELSTASAPSLETTSQKVEIPQAITVSGSSSSIKSSELDNLDTSGPDVNHPTPTSKRSLRHPRDEVPRPDVQIYTVNQPCICCQTPGA